MALTGDAEPSALAGAESISMSGVPTAGGSATVRLIGTRLAVVVEVPGAEPGTRPARLLA